MEATQVPINGHWIKKRWYMNGPRGYYALKMSSRGRQMPHNFTYMYKTKNKQTKRTNTIETDSYIQRMD